MYFSETISAFQNIRSHKSALKEMVKQDLFDVHAGQIGGVAWAFLQPLLFMAIYVLVFSFILGSRLDLSSIGGFDYTTYILAGLSIWLILNDCILRGMDAILNQANLIKQEALPAEIFIVKSVFASILRRLPSLMILFFYVYFSFGYLPLSYLALPFIMTFSVC